jgi:hypothetical protein
MKRKGADGGWPHSALDTCDSDVEVLILLALLSCLSSTSRPSLRPPT